MGRSRAVLMAAVWLGATLPSTVWGGPKPAPEQSAFARDPHALVRQLGDPQFAARKRATAQLVELGADAIEALEEGVQSRDREIQYRSRHALQVIREQDFQRRLRSFAAGLDSRERYELPGWPLFRKDYGDTVEARSLFVEMQQSEPTLLQALDRSSDDALEVLMQRVAEIQQQARQGENLRQLSLGSITTFLFVLNHTSGGEPAELTGHNIGSYFRQESFSGALQAGSHRDLLRKMLGTWIARAEGWDAFYAIILAMQFDIAEGLRPAQRVLETQGGDPNLPYYRGFALQVFAKFGDASHVPVIEPFLDDTTSYGGSVTVAQNAKYRTQIRDIALATVVHLTKQDPQEFGLTRMKLMGSTQFFNTGSIAFEDDAQRDEAIAKWKAFQAARRPD